MNVQILSRQEIEDYVPEEKCVIISVASLDKDFPVIKPNSYIVDIYRTKFNDVESGSDCITSIQAKEIAKFIKKYYDKINTIICQCEAGISRSAGIAKAICDYYNLEFPIVYVYSEVFHGKVYKYCPNLSVYQLVLKYLNEV